MTTISDKAREEALSVLGEWLKDMPRYMGEAPKAQHYQRNVRALETAIAALSTPSPVDARAAALGYESAIDLALLNKARVDELLAANSELVERRRILSDALKPFADCVEHIEKTESDDEWAKFRLLVSDYRRAHEALQSTQPEATP